MDSNTLQISMNNLSEEERNTLLSLIEKANKPVNKVWKPKDNEIYYYLNTEGETMVDTYSLHPIDEKRYKVGNCFKTVEEVEIALEKQNVITELKRFAIEHNEGEIDWNNKKQRKYTFFYNYNEESIDTVFNRWCKDNTIYFSSEEIAKAAIEQIGKERLKKYYFEVND